jgi:hypothetical protein
MDLKKDYKEFLSDNPTQAYIIVSAVMIGLLLYGAISEENFANIYTWIAVSYFGQYITNLSQVKKMVK